MTRRREVERRLDAIEERTTQQDDVLRDVADHDVPDERVDAVITASRKRLANGDLDSDEVALLDLLDRETPETP